MTVTKAPPPPRESLLGIQEGKGGWKGVIGASGVGLVLGERRGGKSALAWERAERLHDEGRPVVAYLFPKEARRLLPAWVQHVQDFAVLGQQPTGTVVVADEAVLHAASTEFSSAGNRALHRLVAVCGHKDLFLLYLAQNSKQPDPWLVTEVDALLLKRPTFFHIAFARPELRPLLEAAAARFDAVKDPRQWTWVLDARSREWRFIKNGLPSFWTPALSQAYSQWGVGQEPKQAAKRSQGGKSLVVAMGPREGRRR